MSPELAVEEAARQRQTRPVCRGVTVLLLAVVLGLAATACSGGGHGSSSATSRTGAASAGSVPTLGVAGAFGPDGVGFGSVRPTEISLGGDPTGTLARISWQSWGGSRATGTGTSTYVAPDQTVAQGSQQTATVVAYDLGTCNGGRAYQQVTWYFPQHGQTTADNGGTPVGACTGP